MAERALDILDHYKNLVWPVISKYLKNPDYPQNFQIPSKYSGMNDFHWSVLREYPKRKGKYVRPTLLLLTAEAMGTPLNKAITSAAAMQMSEEWLLIHDDFEDGSIQRRGMPALNKLYGNEISVNAGDGLHVIMWKTLSDNENIVGKDNAVAIRKEFYKMLSRTILGQTVEIKWSKENKLNISDEDWFFICDGKTSYYTIAGPMRLGAILSGANNKQLDLLSEFGIYLGRCFQLVDDILDITTDFGGLKQKGNDVYEGKKTIIVGHLFRSLNQKDKARLRYIYTKNRENKTQADVNWVISKMEEKGSIEYAKQLAVFLEEKALAMFEHNLSFLSKEPTRDNLQQIINFILERDR